MPGSATGRVGAGEELGGGQLGVESVAGDEFGVGSGPPAVRWWAFTPLTGWRGSGRPPSRCTRRTGSPRASPMGSISCRCTAIHPASGRCTRPMRWPAGAEPPARRRRTVRPGPRTEQPRRASVPHLGHQPGRRPPQPSAGHLPRYRRTSARGTGTERNRQQPPPRRQPQRRQYPPPAGHRDLPAHRKPRRPARQGNPEPARPPAHPNATRKLPIRAAAAIKFTAHWGISVRSPVAGQARYLRRAPPGCRRERAHQGGGDG